RSGALMGLVGAAVTFRLAHFYQRALATALKEGLVSVAKEIELGLEPPRSYVLLSYFGYLTGIVGTGIWGYGDLLIGSISLIRLALRPVPRRHRPSMKCRRHFALLSGYPVPQSAPKPLTCPADLAPRAH